MKHSSQLGREERGALCRGVRVGVREDSVNKSWIAFAGRRSRRSHLRFLFRAQYVAAVLISLAGLGQADAPSLHKELHVARPELLDLEQVNTGSTAAAAEPHFTEETMPKLSPTCLLYTSPSPRD